MPSLTRVGDAKIKILPPSTHSLYYIQVDGKIGYFFKMTQQAQIIQGSIVAIVTPMFEDGRVDWKGLEKLVEWHIAQGTNSIVAVGTTGEASTLSMTEHTEVIKEIIRVANKRIPIIAGTGANSTHEAIELTKEAKELGADAALYTTLTLHMKMLVSDEILLEESSKNPGVYAWPSAMGRWAVSRCAGIMGRGARPWFAKRGDTVSDVAESCSGFSLRLREQPFAERLC